MSEFLIKVFENIFNKIFIYLFTQKSITFFRYIRYMYMFIWIKQRTISLISLYILFQNYYYFFVFLSARIIEVQIRESGLFFDRSCKDFANVYFQNLVYFYKNNQSYHFVRALAVSSLAFAIGQKTKVCPTMQLTMLSNVEPPRLRSLFRASMTIWLVTCW